MLLMYVCNVFAVHDNRGSTNERTAKDVRHCSPCMVSQVV